MPPLICCSGKVQPSDHPPTTSSCESDDGVNYAAFWEDHADIDATNRETLTVGINADRGLVSSEEVRIITVAKSLLAKFDMGEMNTTKLRMRSPLLTATISERTSNKKTTKENQTVDTTVFGSVSCLIRGASINQMLAYSMDIDSFYLRKHTFDSKNTLSSKMLERVNSHHVVFYYKGRLPHPFQSREIVMSYLWEKQNSTQCICIAQPAHHEDAPPSPDTVRAESTRVIRFTEVKDRVVKYELLFSFDLKGNFPSMLTEKVVIPVSMGSASRIQTYFLQIQSPADFDVGGEDGSMLGQLLMDTIGTKKGEDLNAALSKFFHRTAALREMGAKYIWFEGLVVDLVAGKKRFAKWESVVKSDTTLAKFTPPDAVVAAKLFAKVLVGNTYRDAVEEWMEAYEALQQVRTDRMGGRALSPPHPPRPPHHIFNH